LKELTKEGKIFNKNRKYYLEDLDLGNIYNFARHMKEAGRIMISRNPQGSFGYSTENSPYSPLTIPKIRDDLLARTGDNIISDNFCEIQFCDSQSNQTEELFFETVNRMAAFIAYMFLESMRPLDAYNANQTTKITEHKNKFSATLIRKAIDLDDLFNAFCYSLLIRPDSKTDKLDKHIFNKVYEASKAVHPKIHEGFRQYWSSSARHTTLKNLLVTREILMETRSPPCKHRWEEFRIYRIDEKYHICKNCNLMMCDEDMNSLNGKSIGVQEKSGEQKLQMESKPKSRIRLRDKHLPYLLRE
jgi:hypothetical protein